MWLNAYPLLFPSGPATFNLRNWQNEQSFLSFTDFCFSCQEVSSAQTSVCRRLPISQWREKRESSPLESYSSLWLWHQPSGTEPPGIALLPTQGALRAKRRVSLLLSFSGVSDFLLLDRDLCNSVPARKLQVKLFKQGNGPHLPPYDKAHSLNKYVLRQEPFWVWGESRGWNRWKALLPQSLAFRWEQENKYKNL